MAEMANMGLVGPGGMFPNVNMGMMNYMGGMSGFDSLMNSGMNGYGNMNYMGIDSYNGFNYYGNYDQSQQYFGKNNFNGSKGRGKSDGSKGRGKSGKGK